MNNEKATELPEIEASSLNTVEAVKLFKQYKDKLDMAKAAKTELQKRYDLLRFTILPKLMEEEDIANISVEGDGPKPIRVRVQDDVYASIPAAERGKAYEWLKNHNLGDLVIETVNASSLKALAKEKAGKGESLPEDMFKITFSPGARFY